MKKLWIGIAAGAGILAAVLLTLYLLAPTVRDSGDTDSRYPYTYTERKDGLDVTVTGEVPEGYAWVAELNSSTAVSAEITKSTDSKTVVSLRVLHGGTANLRLVLQKENGRLIDRIYELDIYLLADSEGKLKVMENDHREHPGVETGTLSGKEYTIASLEDGRLAIQVEDISLWIAEAAQENVGVYSRNDLIYVEGFVQGEDSVRIYHSEAAEALNLDLLVEGTTVILRSVSTTAAPKPMSAYTNYKLFAGMYGAPVCPEGAELLDADVQLQRSYTEPELEIAVGVLTYDFGGEHWELLCTGQSRLDDLFRELAEDQPNAKSGAVQGVELQAYANAQRAAAGCVLEDGTALLIQGDGFSADRALSRLSEIITVMQHG